MKATCDFTLVAFLRASDLLRYLFCSCVWRCFLACFGDWLSLTTRRSHWPCFKIVFGVNLIWLVETWFVSFQVTRAMLLWVNNHYGDFESDTVMEGYLETFEKGLEFQVTTGIFFFFLAFSFFFSLVELKYHINPWKFWCDLIFLSFLFLLKQQMSGQLGLLNIACAAKAKSRRITMVRYFSAYLWYLNRTE